MGDVTEVKKGKGNPNAGKNSPFVGNNAIKCTDTEMSAILENCLDVYKWEKVDTENPEQIEIRCAEYFEHCKDIGERPSVEGLAVSIGVSVRTLLDWETGKTRTDEHSRIIKKAKGLIQYFLAQIALGNKIYPNVWIFYGKNWFGMKDTQDIQITPNTALGDQLTPEEIAKRLPQDIPLDVDYKEE